ncbi:ras guanine nucleotide exchange factor domain-containing protein [Coprinopsis sp. MPI-PUGE-AT-0042]|nr:ras guanine nucleotide exchange factor domain-containing protein [Coprinopsis sp. MPI-PUGE-AT-0042]
MDSLTGPSEARRVSDSAAQRFLKPEYSVILNTDGTVKSGTLPALVELLTSHEQLGTDNEFNNIFLTTFKLITAVSNAVDMLVARYRIQPPAGLNPEELKEWEVEKQNVVQLRVLSVLKDIVEGDSITKEDLPALASVEAFLNSEERLTEATPLLNVVARTKERLLNQSKQGSRSPERSSRPAPAELHIGEIEPLQLAEQLTLQESKLFRETRPIEYMDRATDRITTNKDNVALVIERNNRVQNWVESMVLSEEDPGKRAGFVEYFIAVADHCHNLRNFSTMYAIMSGLRTPAICRLKRTWEQVDQPHMKLFGSCEAVMDRRNVIPTHPLPCVPFIGTFLSTLYFIHHGSQMIVVSEQINFHRCRKTYEVLEDITRYQAQPFDLAPVPRVAAVIEGLLCKEVNIGEDRDALWAISMEREPRDKRDDEKMARLLEESGFL